MDPPLRHHGLSWLGTDVGILGILSFVAWSFAQGLGIEDLLFGVGPLERLSVSCVEGSCTSEVPCGGNIRTAPRTIASLRLSVSAEGRLRNLGQFRS